MLINKIDIEFISDIEINTGYYNWSNFKVNIKNKTNIQKNIFSSWININNLGVESWCYLKGSIDKNVLNFSIKGYLKTIDKINIDWYYTTDDNFYDLIIKSFNA